MKYIKTKHEGIYSYQTKSGKRYRVRIFYDWNKEHSKSGFESLAEAQAYMRVMQSKLIVSGSGIFKGNTITLKDQWESYKEYKINNKDWNLNTTENSQYKMRYFLEKLSNTPLNDINGKKVQRIIDNLYKNHDYSQETVYSYFSMFKAVMDDAVREGYIENNKVSKVSWKKGNWRPKEKSITLNELKEFIDLAEKNMSKDVFRCFYLLNYGLRRGEAYGIRKKDITFLPDGLAKLSIDVQRTRNYTNGTNVKTKNSRRFVIVDEKTANLLHEQLEYAKAIKSNLNQTLHKDDFIFIHTNGSPFAEKTLNKAIDRVSKLMKDPKKLSPHMFRHTFITQSIGAGINPLQLKTVAGHSSLAMTDHYTHSSDQSALEILNATRFLREKVE